MVDSKIFGRTFGAPELRGLAHSQQGPGRHGARYSTSSRSTSRSPAGRRSPTVPFSEGYIIKPRRAGGTLFEAAFGLHAGLCRTTASSWGPAKWRPWL